MDHTDTHINTGRISLKAHCVVLCVNNLYIHYRRWRVRAALEGPSHLFQRKHILLTSISHRTKEEGLGCICNNTILIPTDLTAAAEHSILPDGLSLCLPAYLAACTSSCLSPCLFACQSVARLCSLPASACNRLELICMSVMLQGRKACCLGYCRLSSEQHLKNRCS